ncbi:hypothetical protein AV650_01695 [Serratia fonticola]|nr:hypothetical protein AV650_01695 [Serratia fonticola]
MGEGWGEGKQTTLELALQGNDQKEAEISAGKMAGCKNGGYTKQRLLEHIGIMPFLPQITVVLFQAGITSAIRD